MLQLAILGLLQEAPVHGYELRKQLGRRLGSRVFSFGSLYPALRRLTRAGLIVDDPTTEVEPGSWPGRGRRVYRITDEGRTRLAAMLAGPGPGCWDDGSFGVHVAFFSRTPVDARLCILEGRRRTVVERRDGLRSALGGAGGPIDRYTRELHRLGLESTEREVHWLDDLIDHERAELRSACPPAPHRDIP